MNHQLMWDFGATDVYAAVTLASIMAEVIVSGVNNTREVTRSIPVTFRNLCTPHAETAKVDLREAILQKITEFYEIIS